MKPSEEIHTLRLAVIGLLWNEIADDSDCNGECEELGEKPYPICRAMRALGWGEHFSAKRFQRRAAREGGAA